MPNHPWGARGEWYLVAQAALFALIAAGPLLPVGPRSWPAPWSQLAFAAGALLALAGSLAGLAAVRYLGRRNLSALPYPTEEAALVQSGPYAVVRHPIYSGLVVAAVGWGLLTHSLASLAGAALLAVLFDLKTRFEERRLRQRFPGYAAYQQRVRKFIPFVY